MPKSDNVITVRLNEKQMKAYHNDKTFTLKPSDITDLSNHEIRLHFNAKKHINRLTKNFNKGSGTRISPNDLVDVKIKMGNGMFDSLKGVMNSKLTKGIVKAVAPQVGQIVGNQIKNIHTTCYYPSYQFLIDWNGDVFLCPQDWQRRQTMGNIMQEDFFEIWKGPILTKYRKKLLSGERSLNPCNQCNADGMVYGEKHHKAWTVNSAKK